ncbi:MAG: ClpXP protease specificity-enhancing factor SspB, partial [Micropepsaceae bacterium]
PGVDIPDYLKERFPDEMTIVLQNQFWGLKVEDEKFEVTLTFQKLPATLVVPFAALTGFADPSVKYGLQFRNASPHIATAIKGAAEEPAQPAESEDEQTIEPDQTSEADKTASGESQVVSLDQFRKK